MPVDGGGQNQWERDAIHAERAMYRHDGEKVWDEAYAENPPIPDDWDK